MTASNRRLRSAIAAIFLIAICQVLNAHAQTPCVLGYTVGFFNGVGNTEADAFDSLSALQAAGQETIGNTQDSFHNEDVVYQLFYNHTGSTVGSNTLQDLAEVFIQRANALDSSGYLSTNAFYLFWELVTGTDSFTSVAVGGSPASLSAFVDDFTSATVTAAVAALSSIFFAPPTSADYATQQATLDTLGMLNRKLVLVAHSQGNLFVNPAYDHIAPIIGTNRVTTVHIAPASPTLRGQPLYILSDNDRIINALRLDGGFSSIPANNITIPISSSDKTGHALVSTYLDVARNGRAKTESLLLAALTSLASPQCSVSLTPTSSNVQPGGSVSFTANVVPAPTDVRLNVGYLWTLSGSAGGMFSTAAGMATTATTTSPTITYSAPLSAAGGEQDVVSTKVFVGQTVGDSVNAESIGTASASVSIASTLKGFWQGTYTINACSVPNPRAGTGGAQNMCNIAINWPNSYANNGTISFRVNSGEANDFRRDYSAPGFGQVCASGSASIPSQSGIFDEPLLQNDYSNLNVVVKNSAHWVITAATPTAINGTFSVTFDYPAPNNTGGTDGTLSGTWTATPLSTPFPKCVPSAVPIGTTGILDPFCTPNLGGVAPSGGACPYLPITSPYRPGEWQGLP